MSPPAPRMPRSWRHVVVAFFLCGLDLSGCLDAQQLAVEIDPEADRRPVDPRIYGVNLGDNSRNEELRYPLRRWGGNQTTRYNWRLDVSNRGADYFFQNIANDDPGTLPHGSEADRFVDSTLHNGGEALLTVPLIGWTPTDRRKRWAFSVAKYGSQDLVECDLYNPPPDWCSNDAGNGECAGVANNTGFCAGGQIVGNDPADTSDAIDESFVTDWMAHVRGRVGRADQGGVGLFALDNEPMLWNLTHRDVHPAALSYDEAWSRTVEVASAIKAADAGAKVLGPVVWGWCAYFTSAADGGCVDGPDRRAHGGLAFLPWYLEQVCEHQAATGVRLVDYLDVHFYPQGGVSGTSSSSSSENAETAARRLRSIKELYDPDYVSESWVSEPIALIPRLRDWIDEHCPGTGLALTEYRWGADDGTSSALAHAEVLAILGREGVDVASRWLAPEPGSRTEDAFRLYLDYDGRAGRVAGESVRATSSDVDAVGAYAIRAAGPELYVLLFNKEITERDVQVTVARETLAGSVSLYGFDAERRLGSRGSAAVRNGTFSLTLPARSATLAVARQRSASGCTPSPTTLCLNQGRFAVEIDWRDARGNSGQANASDLSADSGFFTFFGRNNAEVFIKVLNTCKPPWNNYWVFETHLSNVEYRITVTDTQTGQTRTVFNPLGHTAPSILGTDTIFTECGDGTGAGLPASELIDTSDLPPSTKPVIREFIDPKVTGSCVADDRAICLAGNRFRVRATFEDTRGNSGAARMWSLTSDSGYATFYGPGNVELFMKVLDTCGSPSNNFWVFTGGLTNVAVDLYVEDTVTGKVWHQKNPQGKEFALALDTGTFFNDCP